MSKRYGQTPDLMVADWLHGSEMGKLVRTLDWSKTPLGPLHSWSNTLRTIVSLSLASNFPIGLVWGPQRTQIYNDGYWPILGAKHPQSMGQDFKECWFSAWPVIGPAFEQAAAGRASVLTNQRMFLERAGYLEETFFTASFSPILDETGKAAGVFHPVTELTQQSLAERRLEVLRTLAEATMPARTLKDAVALAMNALTDAPQDLPFVLIYLIDSEQNYASLLGQAGLPLGHPAARQQIDLTTSSPDMWPLSQMVRSRRSEQINNLKARFGHVIARPYREPLTSALLMPIIPPGQNAVLGAFIAGVSPRRALDDAYQTFYQLLNKAISDAFSNSRAYELAVHRADELATIDRAKTAFYSNVSHEFRTPLTLMLSPLGELLSAPPGTLVERHREWAELAHRSALRLLKLVNALLDFARIEEGRMEAKFRPSDLATVTTEMASMFASAMESAGLAYVVDCPALPEPIYIDTELWEKIVLNLISNAFKFTLAGTIAVTLRWIDGQVILRVTDTGSGIPERELPRLFERFHRVPNAHSRSYEGSGIGLALVQELVKLHGGRIQVESVLGRGSSFTITVPGGKAHLPAERVKGGKEQVSTAIEAQAYVDEVKRWLPQTQPLPITPLPTEPVAGYRPRILWVDDNADLRAYVRGLLSPFWDVEVALDGQQALLSASAHPPDLVLTDIMMPNLDGFGLLCGLRANPHTRFVPVILLSARAGEEARVEGLAAGADDYLVKPFSARELLARVNTHLGIARLRLEAVEAAQHDALTGLPNRKLSYQFAEHLIDSARRGKSRVAMLFIDMDRFKPINDTHGHEIGDAVLKEVARRLKTCVRGEDTAGRLGGDEFLVVLSHIHGEQDAAHSARHLVDCLSQPYCIGDLMLDTSPSIGISLFPDDGSDIETLLQNADIAMYRAKEAGRGGFQLYTPALNESAGQILRVETRLRGGLAQKEFTFDYQPIVDVSTGKVIGVEALMRWPVVGMGPSDFIPVAEACGLIGAIGDWGLIEACRQAREWLDQGLPPMQISVNVSPLQFRQPNLSDQVKAALQKFRLNPSDLQLELTETCLLKNLSEALVIMYDLRRLGVKLALDDFGQGYSSLGRLGRLPLDAIKVDQEFVMKLATGDRANLAITEAIIGISKTLGLGVVAEGVDSAMVKTLLSEMACPQMQGYYMSPPLSPAKFKDWYLHRQTV